MKAKAKAKAKPTGMVLPRPDELNEPPTNLGDYVMCLYGKKAVGKTTLASRFPGAIVGQLESGRRNLRIRQVTLDQGWKQSQDFMRACVEDDTVQTIVIDTIDVLHAQCMAYECEIRGISDPSEVKDFGATWRAIADSFKGFLNDTLGSGKGLIVISHDKVREVQVRTGDAYDLIIPSCSKGAFDWVQEACDLLFYYGYHSKQRAVSVRPMSDANTEVACACGPEGYFLDPNGTPISIFEVGNTPEIAYKDVVDAFHNKKWDVIRGEQIVQDKNLKKTGKVKAKG